MLLLLFAILILTKRASSFPDKCCALGSSDSLQPAQCVCLENDASTKVYHLQAGSSLHFHWRLEDLTLINHPDDYRSWLSLHTLACWGQFATYVSGQPLKYPSSKDAWYSSDGTSGFGALRFEILYSSYLITVTSIRSGNFSLISSTSEGTIPIPTNKGRLKTTQIGKNAIKVEFPPSISTSPISYGIFYQEFNDANRMINMTTKDTERCSEKGTRSGLCTGERAIMHTPCGLRKNGILAGIIENKPTGIDAMRSRSNKPYLLGRENSEMLTAYDLSPKKITNITVPESEMVSFVIEDLPLGELIYVNVLAQGKHFQRAYEGQLVRLSFGRVASLFSLTSIFLVIGIALTLVLILLTLAAYTRARVQNTITRSKKYQ